VGNGIQRDYHHKKSWFRPSNAYLMQRADIIIFTLQLVPTNRNHKSLSSSLISISERAINDLLVPWICPGSIILISCECSRFSTDDQVQKLLGQISKNTADNFNIFRCR